jgi:murein DD-endopeptidase MepM/ murein hydrolase activator NlpD
VVVAHGGGLRTTYEPVERRVSPGTPVEAGDVLGIVGSAVSHCAPATCLHWGLRRGADYLDPLTLVDRGPPVLLPLG